jgi:WD40 repeat protein
MRTWFILLMLVFLVLPGCRPAPSAVDSNGAPATPGSEAPQLIENSLTPSPLVGAPTATLLPSVSPPASQEPPSSGTSDSGIPEVGGDVLTSTLTNTLEISVSVVQDGTVNQVAWSPDGELLAAATSSGVHLYNGTTLQKIGELDPAAHFLSLAFNPFDGELVLGGLDSKIYWWDPQASEYLGSFDGHLLGVSALVFNSLGDRLVSASDDGVVRIWDTSLTFIPGFSSGESLFVFKPASGRITRVSFAQDDQRLAVASYAGVHWVDTQTWETLEIFTPQSGLVNSLAISPDNRWLVSAGHDGLLQTFYLFGAGSPHKFDLGADGEILALAYSPDNRYLVGGDLNGRVLLWGNPVDDFIVIDADFNILGDHQASVTSLAFHPDGLRLASSSADGVIKIWQLPPVTQSSEGEN